MTPDLIVASAIVERHSSVLEGTAAAAPDGRLCVFHHATNKAFDRFEKTADIGFHFGSWTQAEKRRANMISRGEGEVEDEWTTISCALAVRNPLVIADDPGCWGVFWVTEKLVSYLDTDDREEIRSIAAPLLSEDELRWEEKREIVDEWFAVLRRALIKSGFDGIVYRNLFEASGKAMEWSWVVFDDSQVVRLGALPGVDAIKTDIRLGKPPKLRGAGPMRHHQDRGVGRFVRETDIQKFRNSVLDWAKESGIEWIQSYPLDYEPSFGECRPSHDLVAKIEGDVSIGIRVSSRNGTVEFQPLSKERRSDELMLAFRSEASQSFYCQGTRAVEYSDTVIWGPAETVDQFRNRLSAVYQDMRATYLESDAEPSIAVGW
jgi:hypothetical protein